VSWYSVGGAHRWSIGLSAYSDHSALDAVPLAGVFTFSNLAAFRANQPESFVRELGTVNAVASSENLSMFAGDLWSPNSRVHVQYGLRFDAAVTAQAQQQSAAAHIPSLDNVRRVRQMAASPRVGVSWNLATNVPRVTNLRPGVIRLGAGRFQNAATSSAVSAVARSGTLECYGAATPIPDWRTYLEDPSVIPRDCVGIQPGDSVGIVPTSLSGLARGYSLPHAWRTSIEWIGGFKALHLDVGATYSLNLDEPSRIDHNRSHTERFVLESEGGRPIFVDASEIHPTGSVPESAARVDGRFGRAHSMHSDLRSERAEFNVGIGKFASQFGLGSRWAVRYVYAIGRDFSRGFDGVTFGDPFVPSWARASSNVRHRLSLSTSHPLGRIANVLAVWQFRSGQPFSPIVGADINGDGLVNDIAFTTDETMLADVVRHVGPLGRACVRRLASHAPTRNLCDGPWTVRVMAALESSPGSGLLPARWVARLSIDNVLGLLDRSLHGSSHLRGWGSVGNVDPVLLQPTAFFAATRNFGYTVNPQFGRRQQARQATAPWTIRLEFRLNLGPSVLRARVKSVADGG
jgi:hypothetical protein